MRHNTRRKVMNSILLIVWTGHTQNDVIMLVNGGLNINSKTYTWWYLNHNPRHSQKDGRNMTFNPPSEIQVTRRQIPSWKSIPNTEIQGYPLMVYHAAFDATSTQLKRRLELIGEVMPQWVYTMYSQTHFHSTTHEVLGVVAGRAKLCFGGWRQSPAFRANGPTRWSNYSPRRSWA